MATDGYHGHEWVIGETHRRGAHLSAELQHFAFGQCHFSSLQALLCERLRHARQIWASSISYAFAMMLTEEDKRHTRDDQTIPKSQK